MDIDTKINILIENLTELTNKTLQNRQYIYTMSEGLKIIRMTQTEYQSLVFENELFNILLQNKYAISKSAQETSSSSSSLDPEENTMDNMYINSDRIVFANTEYPFSLIICSHEANRSSIFVNNTGLVIIKFILYLRMLNKYIGCPDRTNCFLAINMRLLPFGRVCIDVDYKMPFGGNGLDDDDDLTDQEYGKFIEDCFKIVCNFTTTGSVLMTKNCFTPNTRSFHLITEQQFDTTTKQIIFRKIVQAIRQINNCVKIDLVYVWMLPFGRGHIPVRKYNRKTQECIDIEYPYTEADFELMMPFDLSHGTDNLHTLYTLNTTTNPGNNMDNDNYEHNTLKYPRRNVPSSSRNRNVDHNEDNSNDDGDEDGDDDSDVDAEDDDTFINDISAIDTNVNDDITLYDSNCTDMLQEYHNDEVVYSYSIYGTNDIRQNLQLAIKVLSFKYDFAFNSRPNYRYEQGYFSRVFGHKYNTFFIIMSNKKLIFENNWQIPKSKPKQRPNEMYEIYRFINHRLLNNLTSIEDMFKLMPSNLVRRNVNIGNVNELHTAKTCNLKRLRKLNVKRKFTAAVPEIIINATQLTRIEDDQKDVIPASMQHPWPYIIDGRAELRSSASTYTKNLFEFYNRAIIPNVYPYENYCGIMTCFQNIQSMFSASIVENTKAICKLILENDTPKIQNYLFPMYEWFCRVHYIDACITTVEYRNIVESWTLKSTLRPIFKQNDINSFRQKFIEMTPGEKVYCKFPISNTPIARIWSHLDPIEKILLHIIYMMIVEHNYSNVFFYIHGIVNTSAQMICSFLLNCIDNSYHSNDILNDNDIAGTTVNRSNDDNVDANNINDNNNDDDDDEDEDDNDSIDDNYNNVQSYASKEFLNFIYMTFLNGGTGFECDYEKRNVHFNMTNLEAYMLDMQKIFVTSPLWYFLGNYQYMDENMEYLKRLDALISIFRQESLPETSQSTNQQSQSMQSRSNNNNSGVSSHQATPAKQTKTGKNPNTSTNNNLNFDKQFQSYNIPVTYQPEIAEIFVRYIMGYYKSDNGTYMYDGTRLSSSHLSTVHMLKPKLVEDPVKYAPIYRHQYGIYNTWTMQFERHISTIHTQITISSDEFSKYPEMFNVYNENIYKILINRFLKSITFTRIINYQKNLGLLLAPIYDPNIETTCKVLNYNIDSIQINIHDLSSSDFVLPEEMFLDVLRTKNKLYEMFRWLYTIICHYSENYSCIITIPSTFIPKCMIPDTLSNGNASNNDSHIESSLSMFQQMAEKSDILNADTNKGERLIQRIHRILEAKKREQRTNITDELQKLSQRELTSLITLFDNIYECEDDVNNSLGNEATNITTDTATTTTTTTSINNHNIDENAIDVGNNDVNDDDNDDDYEDADDNNEDDDNDDDDDDDNSNETESTITTKRKLKKNKKQTKPKKRILDSRTNSTTTTTTTTNSKSTTVIDTEYLTKYNLSVRGSCNNIDVNTLDFFSGDEFTENSKIKLLLNLFNRKLCPEIHQFTVENFQKIIEDNHSHHIIRFVLLILSWFIRTLHIHIFTETKFFREIQQYRQLLYTELTELVFKHNGYFMYNDRITDVSTIFRHYCRNVALDIDSVFTSLFVVDKDLYLDYNSDFESTVPYNIIKDIEDGCVSAIYQGQFIEDTNVDLIRLWARVTVPRNKHRISPLFSLHTATGKSEYLTERCRRHFNNKYYNNFLDSTSLKQNDSRGTDMASELNANLIVCIEEFSSLSEKFKQICGHSTITYKPLFNNAKISYQNNATVVLSTNNDPKCTEEAVIARLHVFPRRIQYANINKYMKFQRNTMCSSTTMLNINNIMTVQLIMEKMPRVVAENYKGNYMMTWLLKRFFLFNILDPITIQTSETLENHNKNFHNMINAQELVLERLNLNTSTSMSLFQFRKLINRICDEHRNLFNSRVDTYNVFTILSDKLKPMIDNEAQTIRVSEKN